MFVNPVVRRYFGHERTVIITVGQLAQRLFLRLNQNKLFAIAAFHGSVVHDVAVHDNDRFSGEIRKTCGEGIAGPDHDGMIDNRMGRRKTVGGVPLFGIEHALDDVYIVCFQPLADLAPRPEADLYRYTHLLGNGPCQVNVIPGRLTILVQKFVRGIIVVPADHNATFLSLYLFDGGEPFDPQVVVGVIGDNDGQPFIEETE